MSDTTIIGPTSIRWELSGPPGWDVDVFLGTAISAGCTAEPIDKGRYRLQGPQEFLTLLASELVKFEMGHTLEIETPPVGTVVLSATVTPARDYRRTTFVHGEDGFSVVARAVDRGLKVSGAGVRRWAVTGPSAVQMLWCQEVQNLDADQALAAWKVTREQIAAEDASQSITVPVRVILPARRRSTQTIKRNDDGEIVGVSTIEVDE